MVEEQAKTDQFPHVPRNCRICIYGLDALDKCEESTKEDDAERKPALLAMIAG